jgi:PLP dependent protein
MAQCQSLSELLAYCHTHSVALLAVTKYATVEQIQALYAAGIRRVGENKVQAMQDKQAVFNPPDLEWVMIGHLQRNKVKKAVAASHRIESIDSLQLARAVSNAAAELDVMLPVYLQLNLTGDSHKYGFSSAEFWAELPALMALPNIAITGCMVMGPHPASDAAIVSVFQAARGMVDQCQAYHRAVVGLSMGMSHDYSLAIQTGSTQIRLGSQLLEWL